MTGCLPRWSTVQPGTGRPHGDSWAQCEAQRTVIEGYLRQRVRLSKVRTLLRRQGVAVSDATLRRFAIAELGFGDSAPTIPIADCGPGEEVQLDTGWMTHLAADATGQRRRFRAWIFTAVLSRHRFVYPVFRETTESAIVACEAAWAFFQGIFRILIVDNPKALVQTADPLAPKLNPVFLEYVQARGFHVDTTRVRHPKDKARVERAVSTVRDDCFAGEVLIDLEQARAHARQWCREDDGLRRHSRTLQPPRAHFETVEQPALRPAPPEPYDIPLWCEPKVARDQHAQVARALYSLPTRYVGQTLRARADRTTVRFYAGAVCVKVHPRLPPGGRAFDRHDFPAEKTVYALRDVEGLARQAERHGDAVGQFARWSWPSSAGSPGGMSRGSVATHLVALPVVCFVSRGRPGRPALRRVGRLPSPSGSSSTRQGSESPAIAALPRLTGPRESPYVTHSKMSGNRLSPASVVLGAPTSTNLHHSDRGRR